MATMEVAYEDVYDFFIKEEEDVDKLDCDKNAGSTEIKHINFSVPTPKCGEVLVACTGNFTFVCSLCSKCFEELETFGVHIHEEHMKLKTEDEKLEVVEDRQDPLYTISTDAKPLSEVSEDSDDSTENNGNEPSVKDESDDEIQLSALKQSLKQVEPSKPGNNESASQIEDGKKHVCDICGRGYMHRRSYQAHIKKAHVPGTKPLKPLKLLEDIPALNLPIDETTCKYCDKHFDDTETLQAHLSTHTGRKRFVCRYCHKTFSCRTTRLQHLSTHTGERHYKCPHCPKTFSGKSNLTSHIRAHLKIKNYSCDYCDKRFVQSSEKKVHELTHTGEKPHQCEECGQRYPTSNKLNEHLRRHKNIKNYKCEICGKAFYGLNLLKNHMPTHTGEKPFTCNICGQSFPRKKSLKTHKQLHSGEKKYVCNKCGKAFAQFAGLYSHMKSHGEKPR